MDKLIINGPAKLSGSVKVSKAKNAYLPILAGVLLNPKPVHLKNLPNLRDIRTIIKLLEKLGVKVTRNGNVTTFDSSNITSFEATYELVKTMRASILVLGPLLSRFHKAKVSLPGGCAIGSRPIDIHLDNFKKMGASINLESGYVEASCEKFNEVTMTLSFPSVGATENLMMGAVISKGKITIKNAALEPEIEDLANFLNSMGAKVSGAGTSTITIEGLESADDLKETEYEAIGDRIEAATYVMAGLITNSEIIIEDINPTHLQAVLDVLIEMGANIDTNENSIHVKKGTYSGVRVDTAPYPGFPTDAQAQLTALATQAKDASIITENIFENRFMHVPELKRLGANIILKGHTAVVEGGKELKAAPVMCTDLRASAALILAALATEGKTEILRIYHLDRGYDRIDEKLKTLGVDLIRVNPGPNEE
jgi:UDP-N-acetylglucosamine 1-carboxyvinyltransferase